MNLKITYWQVWNYKPNAASLAAEIKKDTGVESELVGGSGGIFQVHVNGELVFDKADIGRFPEPGEMSGILKAREP